MISVIVTLIVGAATAASVYVVGNSDTTVHKTQSTTGSQSSTSVTVQSSSSALKHDIQASVSAHVNQATSSAAAQLDAQREEAIDQAQSSFNEAIEQIEEEKETLPEFMLEPLSDMQLQLQEASDQTTERLEDRLQWSKP